MSRRAVLHNQDPIWVYWCSCDSARAVLIDSLSHHVFGELQTNECIHIQATQFILKEVDAIHGISLTVDFTGEYCTGIYISMINTLFTGMSIPSLDHTYNNTHELDSAWSVCNFYIYH